MWLLNSLLLAAQVEEDMADISVQEDDTYVIHGPKSTIPISKETLGKNIQKALLNAPKDAVAMIDGFTHKKLLYSDLLQKCVNLATVLRHHGYSGQSTVMSISSENCLEFFIPIFASFLNGTIMAPLNHAYTPYELEHTLNISTPRVVFCSPEIAQKFVDLKKKLTYIERIIILNHSTLDANNYSNLARQGVQTMDQFIQSSLKDTNVDPRTFQPVEGDISKMAAIILCSSGTTGLPKGVTLSHLCLNVRLAHSRNPLYEQTSACNILGLVPFFHGYGLMITFNALANGHTVICLKQFDEDLFLKSIQDYKIAGLHLAPPLAVFLSKTNKISNYDLSSVEDIIVGSAPLSKSTEEEVKRRLKCPQIRQGYGLTETTLAVTLIARGSLRHGSCGKVMPFVSGKVRDMETGRSLGPHQVGELCWKSPMVMMGYYKNEQATKDTFTSDGWLKSGDMGYYDEDGYFYIIDRLKELIKYKGFQVAPAELEALLLNHPKIVDAGVVGLPDELVGERPLAFVVKNYGADISEEEIKKYVADLVSPQKRLSGGVIFVDSIPKNPSGKILRKELRELLKQNINSKL